MNIRNDLFSSLEEESQCTFKHFHRSTEKITSKIMSTNSCWTHFFVQEKMFSKKYRKWWYSIVFSLQCFFLIYKIFDAFFYNLFHCKANIGTSNWSIFIVFLTQSSSHTPKLSAIFQKQKINKKAQYILNGNILFAEVYTRVQFPIQKTE